jgi:hypothetical protein
MVAVVGMPQAGIAAEAMQAVGILLLHEHQIYHEQAALEQMQPEINLI